LNILITGASGFIGSSLVEKLAEDHHEITVLLHKKKQHKDLKTYQVNSYYSSFSDINNLKKIAKGKEIIFHLAGLINAPREEAYLYYRANVMTTKNLLKAVDCSTLKSFVYCSSVAVYGNLKELPANENTVPKPDNLYGQSKYEAEKICLDFFHQKNIPTVVIRPTWVYGPRDKRTLRLFKAIKKGPFGLINTKKVLIHPVFVYDLVDALILCANNENAYGKIFLVGGEEVIELNQLITLIAKAINKSTPKMFIPLKLAKASAMVLEKLYLPFNKIPPISQRRLEFFSKNQHYDISRAKNVLSFKPKYNLSVGINLTANWYLREGWL